MSLQRPFFDIPGLNERQDNRSPRHNYNNFRRPDRYKPNEQLRNRNVQSNRVCYDRLGYNRSNVNVLNLPNKRPYHGGNSARGVRPPNNSNDNAFSKFKSLEEFKDFRRRLKRKKSLDEEFPGKRLKQTDVDDDALFVPPEDIVRMNREIQAQLETKNASRLIVETICQEYARFYYYSRYKEHHMAEMSAKKKPQQSSKSIVCVPCDCYFSDQGIYDIHCQSGFHNQITKVAAALMVIGLDYLAFHKNENTNLAELRIAEGAGVLVNLSEEQFNYSDIHVTELNLESFVLASFERRMSDNWPQPKSEYFCRICNYSEFQTQQLLDRHLQSARHLDFERHYEEAFCIVCQHHYGDAEQMKQHVQTIEHKKSERKMEFSKRHAIHYWNIWHTKDKSEIPSYQHKQLEDNSSVSDVGKNVDNIKSLQEKNPVKREEPHLRMSIPFVEDDEPLGSRNNKPSISQESKNSKELRLSNSSNLCGQSVSEVVSPTKDVTEYDVEKYLLTGSIDPVVKNSPSNQSLDPYEKSPSKQSLDPYEKSPSKQSLDPYENYINTYCVATSTNAHKQEEKIEEKIEETKTEDELDDFIVPLTGFMCTVCHETLADKTEAMEHQHTNTHKDKIISHKALFSL